MLNAGRVLSMCLMSQIQQWKLILIQRCVKAVEFVRLSVFSSSIVDTAFVIVIFLLFFFLVISASCCLITINIERVTLCFSLCIVLCVGCVLLCIWKDTKWMERMKSQKNSRMVEHWNWHPVVFSVKVNKDDCDKMKLRR